MFLPASSVGRKLVMAATGQLMTVFIILHVAGNSTIFFGNLNAYAAGLHSLWVLLWAVRIVMLPAVILHIIYALQLTVENGKARPVDYMKKENRTSTFAGRNMIWTGAVIGTFLVYHLLQYTFQVTNPALSAYRNLDEAGRPDVFLMVARTLQQPLIAAVYLLGVTALLLHLSHGIQSSFQTWGLNGERSFPFIRKGGSAAATILWLAYAAIPVTIFTGLLLR
ncbi:MAG: succinate dehydrogenase cytochrome b subunit [Nitrospiraceae bacterium]|nr:succinate dehydrogenase cytochrome b subunit [Nitrospiraceae bacterium]